MNNINEEKITPIVIDFSQARNNKLDESFLRMFGAALENVLSVMFDGGSVPLTVRGSKGEIQSFLDVLQSEKRYADSYRKFGLHNPSTYRDKYKLNGAVENFERETGLIYPIH